MEGGPATVRPFALGCAKLRHSRCVRVDPFTHCRHPGAGPWVCAGMTAVRGDSAASPDGIACEDNAAEADGYDTVATTRCNAESANGSEAASESRALTCSALPIATSNSAAFAHSSQSAASPRRPLGSRFSHSRRKRSVRARRTHSLAPPSPPRALPQASCRRHQASLCRLPLTERRRRRQWRRRISKSS